MSEIINTERAAMTLIAHSGNARTQAFTALKEARNGHATKAFELIKEAEKSITEAHNGQTELLVNEANGMKNDISLLLVHAQDHFMSSQLAIDLIKEMINLYQK